MDYRTLKMAEVPVAVAKAWKKLVDTDRKLAEARLAYQLDRRSEKHDALADARNASGNAAINYQRVCRQAGFNQPIRLR